jgi:tetratricopeptide (TPR) repeat protein
MTMRRHWRIAGLGIGLLVALAAATEPSRAEPSESQTARNASGLWAPRPKGEYPIGPRTEKWVARGFEAIVSEDYPAAREALGNLRLPALNPLERATAFQAYAYLAHGEEDLPGAIDFLEKAIAENALTADKSQEMRFQIAQLHLAQEEWPEVVESLDIWFARADKPNSAAYYLLALAYYQMQDLEAALVPAIKTVELSSAPQESWLQLLLALRLTRKDYKEAIPIIEELVLRYPSKDYWIQLSTVHGALGGYEQALVPLQLAYEQGLLSEDDELRRLGQLLLFLELPYRAAHVFEIGLEKKQIKPDSSVYELLSNAWIAAREFDDAVAPLEMAAQLADKGDTFVRLAQVHIQREKWAAAITALESALGKGQLTSPGEAHLLMGIARYSRRQPRQAIPAFRRAREYEATRGEADNWLTHIDRELEAS